MRRTWPGTSGPPIAPPADGVPDTLDVSVPVGCRVLVLGNLLLAPGGEQGSTDPRGPAAAASPGGSAARSDGPFQPSHDPLGELVWALRDWDGPGVVVLNGNVVELDAARPDEQPGSAGASTAGAGASAAGASAAGAGASAAEAAESGRPSAPAPAEALPISRGPLPPTLVDAVSSFLGGGGRRVIYLPGSHDAHIAEDPALRQAVLASGITLARSADLHFATSQDPRVVHVEPGRSLHDAAAGGLGVTAPARPGASPHAGRWLGSESARLGDLGLFSRFMTSRFLYRRLGKRAWLLLLPIAVPLLLRIPWIAWAWAHATSIHVGGSRAATSAAVHAASWRPYLRAALVTTAVELVVVVAVIALLGRWTWEAIDELAPVARLRGIAANDAARDRGRALVASGASGLVTSNTFQAELTHLAGGFYANAGANTLVVDAIPARFGLPPVFATRARTSWLELQAGADLHAVLYDGSGSAHGGNLVERAVARRSPQRPTPVALAAAWPQGGSWPRLAGDDRHRRLIRRVASLSIAATAVVDLLSAVTPPLRGRLHAILEVLPLPATQAAAALVALAGVALAAMARGIRLGQRRAWTIGIVVLGASVFLNLVKGGDFEESLVSLALITFLLGARQHFRAPSNHPPTRAALTTFGGALTGVILLAAGGLEMAERLGHDRHFIFFPRAVAAVAERMVGFHAIALPSHIDRFLSPAMGAIGVGLAAVALAIATRPVRDLRDNLGGHDTMERARDIVRRHGGGTLDYFALRSDKRHFFHRDSLVAYAVFNGICLVSPDPIGPAAEREEVWGAFRRFAEARGWCLSLLAASEEWLPIYRASGLHHLYMGDEAVVDVNRFTLSGNTNKGLRQAHGRIRKYGYTIEFHDPATVDRDLAANLASLMGETRRGEAERGFSMALGRVFDPSDTGLLLAVARNADGTPVGFCQYVPARDINGFSLDVMRHDGGDHPNGLFDFILVETVFHLRDNGFTGLGLNFAAMRSILDGSTADSVARRLERWFFRRLSDSAQMESLWRFNAKFHPDWQPRYIVYDSLERFLPTAIALIRAESIWEIPVVGRFLVPGADKQDAKAAEHAAQAG